MSFSWRKLSPAFGAEVFNIALSEPLDDATVDTLQKAWYDTVTVFFVNPLGFHVLHGCDSFLA